MLSGEYKNECDTNDLSECNENAGMGESSKWKMAP